MRPLTISLACILLALLLIGCTSIADECNITPFPENQHMIKQDDNASENESINIDTNIPNTVEQDTFCEAPEQNQADEAVTGYGNDTSVSSWLMRLDEHIHEHQAQNPVNTKDCGEILEKIKAYNRRETFEFRSIAQSRTSTLQHGGDIFQKLDELTAAEGTTYNIEITRAFLSSGQVALHAKTLVMMQQYFSSMACHGDNAELCDILTMLLSDYEYFVGIIAKTTDKAHFYGND